MSVLVAFYGWPLCLYTVHTSESKNINYEVKPIAKLKGY